MLGPDAGIEPALMEPRSMILPLYESGIRRTRIELILQVWKTYVLPLHQRRAVKTGNAPVLLGRQPSVQTSTLHNPTFIVKKKIFIYFPTIISWFIPMISVSDRI